MQPHVSFITLGVHDLERARRFYDALGWVPSERGGSGLVLYQLNGVILALCRQDRLIDEVGATGFRSLLAHNCLAPDGVDAALARAVSAGGRLLKPVETTSWGRRAVFEDPEGNVWEVAHNEALHRTDDAGVWLDGPAR